MTMRKFIAAAAVAAFATATPAFAADSGDTQITAELAPTCSIVNQSSSIALGAVNEEKDGVFQYTCNFNGSPQLIFTSANGGVKTTENGESTKTYGIWLNDMNPSGPPSSWLQSNNTPQSYVGISNSAPANSVRNPVFKVSLTQALDVAGSYTDTLTIDINP